MLYVELILIGISLSIDTFSLALCIGLNINLNKKYYIYSFVVGLYHFIMPLLGHLINILINNLYMIPSKELFIVTILFIIIGILLDKNDKKNIINPLLFGFSVSIDSFTVGVSLNKEYIFIGSVIFSIISFLFTIVGFKLSGKLKERFNNKSKFVSIIILIIIIIYNILK